MLVQLSSKYSYIFKHNLINEYDIITVNEICRVSQFHLYVDNLTKVEDIQINSLLGRPIAFHIPKPKS